MLLCNLDLLFSIRSNKVFYLIDDLLFEFVGMITEDPVKVVGARSPDGGRSCIASLYRICFSRFDSPLCWNKVFFPIECVYSWIVLIGWRKTLKGIDGIYLFCYHESYGNRRGWSY
ncbi:hypothetical protein M5689_015688 [Euphorbia peplus]|nr:hypothetical protein M5689_015688 [Euphorbia peplus]